MVARGFVRCGTDQRRAPHPAVGGATEELSGGIGGMNRFFHAGLGPGKAGKSPDFPMVCESVRPLNADADADAEAMLPEGLLVRHRIQGRSAPGSTR